MSNCFFKADIMIPDCNLEKWAVIACDQYTSSPKYWRGVAEYVGEEPSALNIVLPECYLSDDNSENIGAINKNMAVYLENNLFVTYKDCLIYVERIQADGRVRKGIVGKIDLEAYEYSEKSNAAIRATEKTVIERIPPRVEIRKDAPLEIPHVMLLVDDGKKQIIESLSENKESFEKLYDFTLMKNGGRISGYLVPDAVADTVIEKLSKLSDINGGLNFCVGDGNHSLATAKECYNLDKNELSRYALCEVVNIHDTALDFEPIYRVVFETEPKALVAAFKKYCEKSTSNEKQTFKCVYCDKTEEITVNATAKLSVGTLQNFLDEYLKENAGKIDYIHDESAVYDLCKNENSIGFIFDGMQKQDLFPAVLSDGSLPRKTFSMGHADDKRFYLEARKIK